MLFRMIGALCVVVLLLVALVVGVGMWTGLVPVPGFLIGLLGGGGDPEESARYYPSDAVGYGWATLAPSGGQMSDLRDLRDRLEESRVFRDVLEDAKHDFEEETGIDFDDGVMSWVGPDLAVGAMEGGRGGLMWVAMLGVRDRAAASDFLGDWLDYVEASRGVDFESASYREFDVMVADGGGESYALTRDWLLMATHEDGLEDVLSRISGDEDDALSSDEDFREARDRMRERRAASLYISPRRAARAMGGLDADAELVLDTGFVGDMDWLALSAGLVERGLVAEVTAPAGIEYPLRVSDLSDPAEKLPPDVLGFVALTFDPDLDRWRDAMRRHEIGDLMGGDVVGDLNWLSQTQASNGGFVQEPLGADDGLDALLDMGLGALEGATGLDLEEDFMDHLGGEFILSVSEADFAATIDDPASHAVDAVLMLSHLGGGGNNLERSMSELIGLLSSSLGVDVDEQDVGAEERAVVLDLDGLADGDISYRPGYVLHGGYLMLGSTDVALERLVARANDDVDALSDNEDYGRAMDLVPDRRQFLGYVDVGRVFRRWDARELGLGADHHRLLEETAGSVAVSVYAPHCEDYSEGWVCDSAEGDEVWRLTLAVTLFPE